MALGAIDGGAVNLLAVEWSWNPSLAMKKDRIVDSSQRYRILNEGFGASVVFDQSADR